MKRISCFVSSSGGCGSDSIEFLIDFGLRNYEGQKIFLLKSSFSENGGESSFGSEPLDQCQIFIERVQHPCLTLTLASIHDTKNISSEDLSLSQDSNELCERGDNRGESGISNKVPSLLVSYLSDLI